VSRVAYAEANVERALRTLPAPRAEKLRVLVLGASSEGDLRVGREQKRIRAAVKSALHRDYIELDVRPAATTSDLLDGITKFRPHVVHFSGHSNEQLIVLRRKRMSPMKAQSSLPRLSPPRCGPPTPHPFSFSLTPVIQLLKSMNWSSMSPRSQSAWPTASRTQTPSATRPRSTQPSPMVNPFNRHTFPDRQPCSSQGSTGRTFQPWPLPPTPTRGPPSWSSQQDKVQKSRNPVPAASGQTTVADTSTFSWSLAESFKRRG